MTPEPLLGGYSEAQQLVIRIEIRYTLSMSANISKLVKEAMGLPTEARAALASELIGSLDGREDAGVEAAWGREILKRLKEVKAGKVRALSWAEARERILRNSGASPAA